MGFVISFLFVFFIIGLSTIFEKKKILSIEGSRKFVHIGVCNWWFIAMYYFISPIVAIIPFCFVIINYISYKKNIFSAMERGEGVKDLGTVYYSISLCILALWSFFINSPEVGLIGILIMGYGDGFAAIVGKKWGKRAFVLNNNKTILGSISVFLISFIISLLTINYYLSPSISDLFVFSLIIGVISMVVEAITPIGFDNISLPLITSLLYYGITKFI